MLNDGDSMGDQLLRRAGHEVVEVGSRQGPPAATVGAPLLITVEETSELLRLGRTRTYEFIRCGSIQSVKVGRRRLVVRSSLDGFVNSLIVAQGERPN